jgi:hypothetical protein
MACRIHTRTRDRPRSGGRGWERFRECSVRGAEQGSEGVMDDVLYPELRGRDERSPAEASGHAVGQYGRRHVIRVTGGIGSYELLLLLHGRPKSLGGSL